MPKNLLILKFLYGRDRPSGLLASKELPAPLCSSAMLRHPITRSDAACRLCLSKTSKCLSGWELYFLS